MREDARILSAGVHVVVGTPGRVYDMLRRRCLRADSIKMFVLDEADEMLSRGFKDQIYDIFQLLPPKLQVGVFSATLPPEALEITRKFMNKPVRGRGRASGRQEGAGRQQLAHRRGVLPAEGCQAPCCRGRFRVRYAQRAAAAPRPFTR